MAKKGEDEREYLSPIQLGRLLPLVPAVLHLLQEANPLAADMFLEGEEVEKKTVNYLMSELLNTLNFNGDLSLMELRFSFASYKIPVWLSMIRNVLTGCWPRIVPDKVASALLGTLASLNEADSSVECAYLLGAPLDRIPRLRYRVLAEFCSFIRDTSSSSEDMASLTGPFLLLPSTTMQQEGTALIASQTAASVAIMDLLISEAEMLFGRPAAAAPKGFPLGKRGVNGSGAANRRSVGKSMIKRISFGRYGGGGGSGTAQTMQTRRAAPVPPSVSSSSPKQTGPGGRDALLIKRKRGLRVFYQWRDPRRVDRVELLFANYEFEEIALAIQRKYHGMPPGWSEQLDYMLLTGNDRKLGWFIRLKQGILPPPIQNAADSSSASKADDPAANALTTVDKVINEIADTETSFNQALQNMVDNYALKIQSIASGAQGTAATKALGLSEEQVKLIFGPRLSKVVEVSNTILSDLEVITVVRMQPKSGKSRVELVSRVFIDSSEQLRVFGPYACAHQTAVMFLRDARKKLEGSSGGPRLRRLGSFLGGEQKNFVEIWNEVSENDPFLRGKTIESILITPIQRVPRYQLLLRELLKNTPEHDPWYTQLAETVNVVKTINTDINEAIRAHERLMKKFGDEMQAPAGYGEGKNLRY